jgi:asparagine synthase (glutamine-hydrolysing)
MCGILGYARADGPELHLQRGLDALSHRGPEASGVRRFQTGTSECVLGYTRLRVIDNSERADQPISDEQGIAWIVYNGELYNHADLRDELMTRGHRFRTSSDTEVIVHLYQDVAGDGDRMLAKLRGMFAFAIFDSARGRLLLARDRLGIKPLYVAFPPGGVAFSSEVRALVKSGVVEGLPDPSGLASFLRWGAVEGPNSIVQGVEELPPGTALEWEGGSTHRWTWWLPAVEPSVVDEGTALEALTASLRDSVARHLVADRPVGIFLSGGVDSGVLATVAAEETRVRTVTVGWTGAADETVGARALARRLGADHHEVQIEGRQIAQHVPEILRCMDQPTSDGVNTWLVSRAAHSAGLVVAFSGVGGDELFGGYPTFRSAPRMAALARLTHLVPTDLRHRIAAPLAARSPGGRVSRALLAGRGLTEAYAATRSLFSPAELPPALPRVDGGAPRGDLATGDMVTLLELRRYLLRQLLRDTDQMSMAHSLEVRVPLLDDEFVSTALSIDAHVRLAPAKSLLARAGGIPVGRPKRPFTLPFDLWLRGPMNGTLREGLLSDELPFAALLPAEFRRRVLAAFIAGRTHWSRPWAIAVLRLWPAANGFRW